LFLSRTSFLKILVATPTFPPNKDGVSEAASAGVKAFLAQGWDVDVATEPSFPSRISKGWHGAFIHEFNITGSQYFRQPYKGALEHYRDFLRLGDWDVILFHSYSWPLYLAVPILDEIRAKKILVSHGYGALVWVPVPQFPFGLLYLAHSAWKSLQMLRWIHKIDRWVFLSLRRDFRAFYDHWLARKIPHPGIAIIPNGVELTDGSRAKGAFRKELGIPQSSPLFLCVANYARRKDQGYAVRAFRRAKIFGSHMVFIGSEFNDSSARFRKEDAPIAASNPAGTIHWMEKVGREQTLQAIADCDVFVLSANHEAQPIALLEAMRESKPWIARNAGCISEMSGGVCVFSEKQMALEMRRLAQEAQARINLGKIGLDAVCEQFSRATYNSAFCQLIREVVSTS
jgi:glycosyltransferase involved in cell wall biosynthesis